MKDKPYRRMMHPPPLTSSHFSSPHISAMFKSAVGLDGSGSIHLGGSWRGAAAAVFSIIFLLYIKNEWGKSFYKSN